MDRLSDFFGYIDKDHKKEENKIKNTNQFNNIVKSTNSMFEGCLVPIVSV